MNNYFLIGDPHIGKKFKSKDIPLDKKGLREQLLKHQFMTLLRKGEESGKPIIILGDLFDSYCVSYDDFLWTFDILKNMNTPVYIIRGNHDYSKDLTRISAFTLLNQLFYHHSMVKLITDITLIGNSLLVPYYHDQDLQPMLEPYIDKGYTIYGHFEEPMYPWLCSHFEHVYTGHLHSPKQEGNLTIVGSIMPFTFGEDPTNSFMKTCTLAEYKEDVLKGLDSGKCYRLKLAEGEELPLGHSSLQMSRYIEKKEIEEDLEVEFEEFDITSLFHSALDNLGLYDEVVNLYDNYRMEEAE